MLVSACFILLLAIINLFFNHRNKYKYIFLAYIIAISLLMIASTVYIYKLTSYSFSSLYDFRLYQLINRLKLSITTIARIQNICNALFMFSALIFVYMFKKLKLAVLLLTCVPIVFFSVVNDPSFTWSLFLRTHGSGNGALAERFMTFNIEASIFLFFWYSIMPLCLLATQFFTTKIRIRKNDCALFFLCLLLLNCFVYTTFFVGSFRVVMFHNVDLLKFPYTSRNGITELLFMPYSIVFIVLTIFTLTIIYKPFKEWRFVTRKEMLNNTRLMNQNLTMILHTYKNAFLGVGRLTKLTNEYIANQNTDKAIACTTQLNQIASVNLRTISHAIEMLKKNNIKYAPINVIDCIEGAINKFCFSNKIALVREYDLQSSKTLETYGDFDHLQEVFVNLFSNAEYSLTNTKRPAIHIKIISEADIFSVEIVDNGCGIEKNQIRNIFKFFYSTKTISNSFGIGLSYVQAIVKQHHGSITVKSEINHYTSFQVVLPRFNKHRNKYNKGAAI